MVSTFPELLGGRPSLDLVNTVDPRIPGGRDYLGAPGDVIAWARHAGVVGADWEASASRVGQRAARAGFRRTVALRELLHGVLSAAAEQRAPAVGLRRELARVVDEVRRHETIAWHDGEWRWRP